MKTTYKKNLTVHTLLLIFTFGVYFFLWIYQVTDFLNSATGEYISPSKAVKNYIFVPFYCFKWARVYSEKLSSLVGSDENITDKCVFYSLPLAIIMSYKMQKMLNELK